MLWNYEKSSNMEKNWAEMSLKFLLMISFMLTVSAALTGALLFVSQQFLVRQLNESLLNKKVKIHAN